MGKKKEYNRRDFIQSGMRLSLALTLGGIGGLTLRKFTSEEWVWQIATECVRNPSAVKCVHAFDLCGYCDLCGGYFIPDPIKLNTGAENQLCPSGAITRKFVEDPFFEYTIDEELCIGCAKCVKGCASFGNGSLHLQIMQDLCRNCNQCSIARVCPSKAIKRVPASKPYLIKGDFTG